MKVLYDPMGLIWSLVIKNFNKTKLKSGNFHVNLSVVSLFLYAFTLLHVDWYKEPFNYWSVIEYYFKLMWIENNVNKSTHVYKSNQITKTNIIGFAFYYILKIFCVIW